MQPACRNATPCGRSASKRWPSGTKNARRIRGASRARRSRPNSSGERREPRRLGDAQQRRGEAHQIEPREQRAKQCGTCGSDEYRVAGCFGAPDLRARRLDELTVMHPGRTNGLAGAAIEALPHLLDEAGAEQVESRFATALIRLIRPRGPEVSVIVSRYVGQDGRQRPQRMHVS